MIYYIRIISKESNGLNKIKGNFYHVSYEYLLSKN